MILLQGRTSCPPLSAVLRDSLRSVAFPQLRSRFEDEDGADPGARIAPDECASALRLEPEFLRRRLNPPRLEITSDLSVFFFFYFFRTTTWESSPTVSRCHRDTTPPPPRTETPCCAGSLIECRRRPPDRFTPSDLRLGFAGFRCSFLARDLLVSSKVRPLS